LAAGRPADMLELSLGISYVICDSHGGFGNKKRPAGGFTHPCIIHPQPNVVK
jgi:hypothetical protein